MNAAARPECPRIDEISELVDGALAGAAREEIANHVVLCPLCAATLRDFTAMRSKLYALRDTRCEVDIAALIESRLPARAAPRHPKRKARWQRAWQLAPRGLAAAGVLAVGVYLGFMLAGGAAVSVVRPAAIAVFDPMPPGALCADSSCAPRRK